MARNHTQSNPPEAYAKVICYPHIYLCYVWRPSLFYCLKVKDEEPLGDFNLIVTLQ
ncbi:hypothetical protein Syun_029694 [Stephania yunnanensis]|uniref:Uncharacterized protein n=1 Tax=Stephania yunnanensis TaxID=152371 RepID=A0AAP0HLL3_9MAGN